MSFGELGRTIGSNWLCLDNMFSWSPRRHSGGRTSESDGASEELWRRAPYPSLVRTYVVYLRTEYLFIYRTQILKYRSTDEKSPTVE